MMAQEVSRDTRAANENLIAGSEHEKKSKMTNIQTLAAENKLDNHRQTSAKT
jgi:hypothetical protein